MPLPRSFTGDHHIAMPIEFCPLGNDKPSRLDKVLHYLLRIESYCAIFFDGRKEIHNLPEWGKCRGVSHYDLSVRQILNTLKPLLLKNRS